VAGSLAGKGAELVTLLALATVVPRALGPAGYGRFAVPLTIVTVGSLALTLGGPTVLGRFVPVAPPAERVALARALGGRLARARAVQLAAVAAGATAASVLAPDALPPVTTWVVLTSLALNVAATLVLQVVLGLGRTGPWSFRYPLHNAVLVVAVLALHPVAPSTGPLLAILLAAVASAGFAVLVAGPVLHARPDPVPLPAGALRFGALHAGGAALAQGALRSPALATAVLGGTAVATGHAALATSVAVALVSVVVQAFTVALPHVAADPEPAEDVLRQLAGRVLAAVLVGATVAALALDRAVPLALGDDFDAAVDAFGPALALVVLAPAHAVIVQAAALRFRPTAALAAGVATAATFVLVSLVTVPAWDATGATVAALAGAAAGVAVGARLLPGAMGSRLGLASFVGTAVVLGIGAA
jgi:hypothetical protein